MPTLANGMPQSFFDGKLDNFLTCLNLSSYLKGKFIDDDGARFFEEVSLKAIDRTLYAGGLQIADVLLLIDDLPKILTMSHPIVSKIRETVLKVIPQVTDFFREKEIWGEYTKMIRVENWLKSFDSMKRRDRF